MTPYLTLALAGAAFGIVLTPLVRAASDALGLVDAPGGRKVHLASVPRLGGLAVAASAVLAMVVVTVAPGPVGASAAPLATLWPVVVGGGLILLIGVLDDITPLSPWPKLAVQFGAAGLVMYFDLRIERITIAGQTWELGIWSWPVTLTWIVGLTNAFNLIDGIDGLAAGIAAIAGATCATILVWRGHHAEALLLAALVGASLGFLVYNSPPASIFLGDGGSLLIGFVLATTAITGWQKGATALAAGVPILIFALPIADSASALVRRIFATSHAQGPSLGSMVRRIIEPDRRHIHHRLLALGLSTRGTVAVLYVISLLLSAIALATARVN
jgi:UDP-GlcNAc:undecaprenyl-phosphate GlcNAc-1-phosphate transferase